MRRLLALSRSALDPMALQARVAADADGAVVTFQGTVRSPDRGVRVRWIDYEGYEEMARAELERIAEDLGSEHALTGLAIVHRLGRCRPGDASLVIVACSAHREAAFAGCRDALEHVKARLPVWKRQVDEDGARWVEGTAGERPVLD